MLGRMKRRDLLGILVGTPLWQGPAVAMTQRPLAFPADFGAHPETRTEWWYVTGALQAGEREFGFQVTFFRSRAAAPGGASGSRFDPTQLVFAHAAVSDLRTRRLRHDQRMARAGFGIAEAAAGDTAVRLRDWSLQRSGTSAQSRYEARLRSDSAGFALALTLSTTQPPLLQGEGGYSRKGPQPGVASHYYSQPQLAVTGTLTLDGRAQPATGRAWLDHEWSDTLLSPDATGWDWIGINLDDGGALTAFQVRRADGTTVYAGGSLRPAGGPVRSFAPGEVRFTPERTWQSPASQARYPVAWSLDTPVGRHRLAARFDAQELDSRASTGAWYWEGLSDLHDVSGRRVGQGFLEMTGYAGRLML